MKNLLSILAVSALFLSLATPTVDAVELQGDYGTATAAAGAATLNKTAGTITSEALTTAAGATYTLTLTNDQVKTTSIVLAQADAVAGAGSPTITSVTPANGSVVIKVQNIHASAAFNAAIKIRYAVVN